MAAGRAPHGPAGRMRAALARRAAGQPASRPEPAAPAPDLPKDPPDDLEPVGRVMDAYGIDGRLKVQPFGTPDDSVLLACKRWWLRLPAAAPSAPGPAGLAPLRVERARVHGATIVARVAGLSDREAALRWRGAEILVPRAQFPAPAEGEYYWIDLVGCEVRNRAGDLLGRVAMVDDHGAHGLLRVQPADGAVFLLPFVEAYVDRVDLAARRIEVDWQADY